MITYPVPAILIPLLQVSDPARLGLRYDEHCSAPDSRAIWAQLYGTTPIRILLTTHGLQAELLGEDDGHWFRRTGTGLGSSGWLTELRSGVRDTLNLLREPSRIPAAREQARQYQFQTPAAQIARPTAPNQAPDQAPDPTLPLGLLSGETLASDMDAFAYAAWRTERTLVRLTPRGDDRHLLVEAALLNTRSGQWQPLGTQTPDLGELDLLLGLAEQYCQTQEPEFVGGQQYGWHHRTEEPGMTPAEAQRLWAPARAAL